MSQAVADLDAGVLDVLIALRAFEDVRTRDGLARLVGADEDTSGDRAGELDRALRKLSENALVFSNKSGQLRMVEPLSRGDGELNLGRRLRPLLDELRADTLSAMARRLGCETTRRKADIVAQLDNALSDPDFVRSLLEAMLAPAREAAETTAWHGPHTSPFSDIGYALTSSGLLEHLRWLTERGLLVPADGELGRHPHLLQSYEMPREIALALRGPTYRAPLRSRPQPPTQHREITDKSSREHGCHVSRLTDHAYTMKFTEH